MLAALVEAELLKLRGPPPTFELTKPDCGGGGALEPQGERILLDLLQKKYVLSLKICSSLGQTLNYWVDWHLLKLAQPARL